MLTPPSLASGLKPYAPFVVSSAYVKESSGWQTYSSFCTAASLIAVANPRRGSAGARGGHAASQRLLNVWNSSPKQYKTHRQTREETGTGTLNIWSCKGIVRERKTMKTNHLSHSSSTASLGIPARVRVFCTLNTFAY